MRVQVSRVDLDGRKIDFRLVTPGEEGIARGFTDKAARDAKPRPGAPPRVAEDFDVRVPPSKAADRKRAAGKKAVRSERSADRPAAKSGKTPRKRR